MFICDSDLYGYVFDFMFLKWYRFEIFYVEIFNWNFVLFFGLVCFMDNDYRRKLFVCNLIIRYCRKFVEFFGVEVFDYCIFAVLLNRLLFSYIVIIVKFK